MALERTVDQSGLDLIVRSIKTGAEMGEEGADPNDAPVFATSITIGETTLTEADLIALLESLD